MIIDLTKSSLFTVSPDDRFTKEHRVPQGTWTEIWRRHVFLEYTIPEMCEYYTLKTGKRTTKQSMVRWKWRTEVFSKVRPIMNKGVRVVNSEFFGPYEMEVVNELLKNIKSSVTKKSRAVI